MNDCVQIWALRYSVGFGWRWLAERGCQAHEAEEWLKIFRADEPTVAFRAQRDRPRSGNLKSA